MTFQSTHSLRSATIWLYGTCYNVSVSIHALLAECDLLFPSTANRLSCFNPRTPCGVRPNRGGFTYSLSVFQSTHSLRSATKKVLYSNYRENVSIHALLAECDFRHAGFRHDDQSFNPRTPCGVRQTVSRDLQTNVIVSIHALLAECDCGGPILIEDVQRFNPRTPCGVRP